MERRINVPLTQSEFNLLGTLAYAQHRIPREHAAHLISDALKREAKRLARLTQPRAAEVRRGS